MLRRTTVLTLIAGTVLLASGPAPLAGQRPGAPAPPRQGSATAESTRDFARLVATLSEPGGYFDTDNLISNERSYLHVIGGLERRGVRGGAYIGVGPDQNFSYIARIRPDIAFLIDIRRDNLLQHLMFKALFARSRNRAEYLALLLGRPVPADVGRWAGRSVEDLVAWADRTSATDASARSARAAVRAAVGGFGLPLSEDDLATIDRFHRAFIDAGLGLRFTSHGRRPRPYYPTLRDLILERDLEGRRASYLAREDDFLFVKDLQRRNRVIPVVGDLAGAHALAAIGRLVRERDQRVSAIYVSNVEDYLFRDGTFERYARTLADLPRTRRSVIIRSYFGSGGGPHPDMVSGHASVQLLQPIDEFAAELSAGRYRWYRDVVFSGSTSAR